MEWIGENTPLTLCDVRVSPNNSVKPNVGTIELADALARVLPFTATDDTRPILQCVNFIAKEGKLTIVSADGFRLAINRLDLDDTEGQALVNRVDLAGVVNALRKAKRARVSFEPSGESLDGMSLVIDTELIRYKWASVEGDFPNWQKLIPTEFHTFASFDTIEAIKAVNSLKTLSDQPKDYPIDLTIGDGKIVMANPDEKGQAELSADTDGEGKIRLDGSYLAQALRACGGMVDFKLTSAYSPMLFSSNGYQLVVMPMMTDLANEQAKQDREARAQAEPVAEAKPKAKGKGKGKGKGKTEPEPVTESEAEPTEVEEAAVVAEAEVIAKTEKPKRSRKREKVAVA